MAHTSAVLYITLEIDRRQETVRQNKSTPESGFSKGG